jgi:hypothetical protein
MSGQVQVTTPMAEWMIDLVDSSFLTISSIQGSFRHISSATYVYSLSIKCVAEGVRCSTS